MKDLYSLYKYNIMLTLKFYINARHYMRAYNCFYYGFHNTSHPLVLLLSCFVAFLLCCCSKLKHRRNGQRIVRVVYATELSTVTVEMDKALLESFMRQFLYEVA